MFLVLCPFLNWLFVFSLSCCRSSLYILDTRPLSDIWFANILSHSEGCLFTFAFWVSFEAKQKKFLIFTKSKIIIFLWLRVFLVSYLINHHLIQGHKDLRLCFLLSRSLIQLELFWIWCEVEANSIICIWISNCLKHYLSKRRLLTYWVCLSPLLAINWQ